MKAGKPKEAIELYVQKQKYDQAFAFGEAHNQLTELLTIYLDNYKNTTSEKDRQTFKTYAIQLMQSKEARNQLKPLEVLQIIPPEWPLKSPDYDLVSFLSSIFDH